MGNWDQTGIDRGMRWRVTHLDGCWFRITVGDRTHTMRTLYFPETRIEPVDVQLINNAIEILLNEELAKRH